MKILLTILLLGASVNAQMNGNIVAGYRSVPSGMNVVATVAHDTLLWGEVFKDRPIYGYYRFGARLGGTPTAAVFAQYAPIAPLVFEIQKGSTYRFTKSQVFDCQKVYCFGVVDRTDVNVKLAAGYKEYVGYISYLWRDIKAPESSNPVSAELENMTMSPGSHSYNEFAIAWGIRLDEERFIGALYIAGLFSENEKRSSSAYVVYNWKWNDFGLTAGAGTYNTDEEFVGGNGVLFAITKKFGDSLSLF